MLEGHIASSQSEQNFAQNKYAAYLHIQGEEVVIPQGQIEEVWVFQDGCFRVLLNPVKARNEATWSLMVERMRFEGLCLKWFSNPVGVVIADRRRLWREQHLGSYQ